MPSTIDPNAVSASVPQSGTPTTAAVRANFLAVQAQLSAAKADLEALEAAIALLDTPVMGPAGSAGAAATVAVGSTQTSDPGTPAAVANVGTSSAAILNFTIPRGQTGAQGQIGEPGEDGSNGLGLPPGALGKEGMVPVWLGPTAGDYELQLQAATLLERIAGNAGFANVSGTAELDLALGRAFHQKMVGNINELLVANVPPTTSVSASWTWVLLIDAVGGYSLSNTPAVTWLDGASFLDLNLSANAVNIVQFLRVGSTNYARLITNGSTELPELAFDFPAAGTIKYVVRTPCTIDVASPTVHGAGIIAYKKNGTVITAATAFAVGDRLEVTAALGQSITLGVFA